MDSDFQVNILMLHASCNNKLYELNSQINQAARRFAHCRAY